jgi:hypothetical protein
MYSKSRYGSLSDALCQKSQIKNSRFAVSVDLSGLSFNLSGLNFSTHQMMM